jgi:hypothetical protein
MKNGYKIDAKPFNMYKKNQYLSGMILFLSSDGLVIVAAETFVAEVDA